MHISINSKKMSNAEFWQLGDNNSKCILIVKYADILTVGFEIIISILQKIETVSIISRPKSALSVYVIKWTTANWLLIFVTRAC